MDAEGYECKGCGARSEAEADAARRYCPICGRSEVEVEAQRRRQVMLAEVLERRARDAA